MNSIIKPLVWSDVREPCEECRYHHVIAETPMGRFVISWKGWKERDSPTIDETPWGDFGGAAIDVDDAKQEAERLWQERIRQCLTLPPPPVPPAATKPIDSTEERALAEKAYTLTALEHVRGPIGSRDFWIFLSGWKARGHG